MRVIYFFLFGLCKYPLQGTRQAFHGVTLLCRCKQGQPWILSDQTSLRWSWIWLKICQQQRQEWFWWTRVTLQRFFLPEESRLESLLRGNVAFPSLCRWRDSGLLEYQWWEGVFDLDACPPFSLSLRQPQWVKVHCTSVKFVKFPGDSEGSKEGILYK